MDPHSHHSFQTDNGFPPQKDWWKLSWLPLDMSGEDSPWLRQVRERGRERWFSSRSISFIRTVHGEHRRTPYKYTGPHSHHSFQSDNWLCGEDAPWSDPLSLHKNEREGMLGLLPQKKRRRFPHGLKMVLGAR